MTDASMPNSDATPNEAATQPITIEQVGPSEVHALIQHAQYAMWDAPDAESDIPYCRVKLSGKAILHVFYQLLPQTEEAEHYRRCQTCARAIETMGNWVVVNFDGSLDSVLFPAIDIPNEFKNEWTNLLFGMNRFIAQQVSDIDASEDYTYPPRLVTSTVCRPLDGASYPKAARTDEREHFGVFTTPRQPQSARTLCKLNDRMFSKANAILRCKGFNSVNIAGLVEMQGIDHEFQQDVYTAINAASIVLWNVDEYADSDVKRANILTTACGFEEGLARFPVELLGVLDKFEENSDYDAMVRSIKALPL